MLGEKREKKKDTSENTSKKNPTTNTCYCNPSKKKKKKRKIAVQELISQKLQNRIEICLNCQKNEASTAAENT